MHTMGYHLGPNICCFSVHKVRESLPPAPPLNPGIRAIIIADAHTVLCGCLFSFKCGMGLCWCVCHLSNMSPLRPDQCHDVVQNPTGGGLEG